MARRPNRKTTCGALGVVLEFKRHEYETLKHNLPGPKGKLGGYQRHENRLIELTDPVTLKCPLTPVLQTRTQTYCLKYGGGGPNGRIRTACIPAFRRVGIELSPDFSPSYQRKQPDAG